MRRALIVGLDDYPSEKHKLSGCVKDAHDLNDMLSRHYDDQPNFDTEVLTAPSAEVTRSVLRKRISELFKHQAEVAFLHFSGHGTMEGIGGYLITPDYCDYDVGIPMTEVLALANQSPVSNIFITLDCCHSGAFGTVPEVCNDKIILADGVSVITATRSNQESLEEGGGGVFTSLLVEALEGGAASMLGEVTAASIYAFIDSALGAWDQRPMFKANVSSFVRLRRAEPRISLELVHKLPNYFPLPAEPLALSPEYESTAEPHDTVREREFRDLQKLRHCGLVEPLGTEHMYYAAVESKSCGLTTMGKYYWRLVTENKI